MQGLDEGSKKSLAQMHPFMQKVFVRVPQYADVIYLDAQRGKAAQEAAFNAGNSKVHFGNSAHNWAPALAADVVPDHDPNLKVRKIDWVHIPQFQSLALIIYRIASEEGVPITWGFDWDGNPKTKNGFNDLPHWQLGHGATGWKAYTKDAKLIGVK